MKKHVCPKCGTQKAEVMSMSSSVNPGGDGITARVTFLCFRCGENTYLEIDGIIVDHLHELVQMTVQQLAEMAKNER